MESIDRYSSVRNKIVFYLFLAWIFGGHTDYVYANDAVADCDPEINLVQNGSFEEPVVTDTHHWDIYDSGYPGMGWNVEWVNIHGSYNSFAQPSPAHLEIHAGVYNWTAADGSQYAEMDTDWNGPASNASINGEPANIRIYQDIATVPGNVYEIHFAHSPRPNTSAATNHLLFLWDNNQEGDFTSAGGGALTWTNQVYQFTATAATTRIEFQETGIEDSLGSFVDQVSVTCIQECLQDADCNDSIACTADQCIAGICHNNPLPANTSCEDGDLCNGAEVCDGNGGCSAGTPVVCPAGGNCFNDGLCDPSSGACIAQPKDAGSSCGDGDACNGDEQCDGNGSCVAGTPVTCDDNNPCTTEYCGENGACVTDDVPAGTSCGDLNPCNGAEACDGNGACQAGSVTDCNDSNPCTADTCQISDGSCLHQDNGLCAEPTEVDDPIVDETNGSGTDSGITGGPLDNPFAGNGIITSNILQGQSMFGCALNPEMADTTLNFGAWTMLGLVGMGLLTGVHARRRSVR